MKKFIAFVVILCAVAVNVRAQEDKSNVQLSAGFNLAPQSVYQFGNEKPEFGIGYFGVFTAAFKKSSASVFYGAGNNSCGIFLCQGFCKNVSAYTVAFKDLNDRGSYAGIGTIYGLGSVGDWFNASAFMEFGVPFGMQNSHPLVCAGTFIGFNKAIKK